MLSFECTGPYNTSFAPNTMTPSKSVKYEYFAKLSCRTSRRRTTRLPCASCAIATMLPNTPYWPVEMPLGPMYVVRVTPGMVLPAASVTVTPFSYTTNPLSG